MQWLALVALMGVSLMGALPLPAGAARGRAGASAPPAVPPSPRAALRLATFNICGGRGRDGRRDLARTARALQGVDVAALQEVHDSWTAPRQLPALAGELGLASLSAPTRWRWFRPHRGNALLSRAPIGTWRRIGLDEGGGRGFQFRNLTVARIEHDGRALWVLFTHLSRREGQAAQLERVMAEFLKYSPAVLLGDLNMRADHPLLRSYLARADIVDALGRALAHDPPSRIDWILGRGVSVKRAGCVDSNASDHPLYWCDIDAQHA